MTQVWSRTDTFDRNPTQVGAQIVQWRACNVQSVGWSAGILADFDGDGQPSVHVPSGTTARCGFLWRERISTEDCSTEAWFTLPQAALLGTLGATLLKPVGVLARVSGGATGGSGTTSSIGNVTGYLFELTLNVGTPSNPRLSFTLYKYVLGTPSALANYTNVPIVPAPSGLIVDLTKPIGLRLDVFSFSSTVNVLTAWISNINVNGNTFNDVNVFELQGLAAGAVVDDVTANPELSARGRSGIALAEDQLDANWNILVAPKVQFFQVKTITGLDGGTFLPIYGPVEVRDEFVRQNSLASLSVTNDFGKVGKSVQSGWFGDMHEATSVNVLGYPTTSLSALAQVAGTTTTGATTYYLISQRPPTDTRRQTPRVRFNLSLSGSTGSQNELGMGVMVHAQSFKASGSANVDAMGYAAFAVCTPGAGPGILWRFDLYRVRQGALELLATGNGTFLAAVTAGATIRVELEATPLPGSPTLDGPVRLKVAGGASGFADQTLTLQGIAGVAADGDYIIDSSSERITSGGEGIVFIEQNGTHVAQIQEWSEGTLVDAATTQNDLPNVAIGAEPTATESLNDYCRVVTPIESKGERFVVAARADSGHTWRLAFEETPRRYWRGVETFPMSTDARDDFLAFWRVHGVPGAAFFFTDENLQATYTVRAVEGTLDEDRLAFDTHVFRFDMEELRT